jgi:TQXA domain-containing protein
MHTPPGFTPKNEGFAGIIYGHEPPTGPTLKLYCIDIFTATYPGVGYGLGTWDAASVPNVGYVARILEEYYPTTPEPTNDPITNAPLTANQTAAAVQAAVWFFSDKYALSTSDPLYQTVVGIVDHVKSQGPLVQPPPPSLTLTPSSVTGGAGSALGPFTLTTNHPPATVTATGAIMYSNRAGTSVLGDGTTASVPSGQKVWLRSAKGSAAAVLQATSTATVPTGNVYLYSGNLNGVNDAQKLILAEHATLTTTVHATAEFKPSGSLVVKKTIAGPAAGSQGPVVIQVMCDDGVNRLPLIIPAGTPAGDQSRTYHHIAVGTTCTVTETSNGTTVGTDVVVTGDGQEVTIPAGGSETVHITDTYNHVGSPTPGPGPGSLLITKTIAGPLAGHQGPVTIHVTCNGAALSPDFTIAAGTAAGSFDGIPAGSVCTVTETTDGATATVTATVSGNGQQVTVPGGQVAAVNVMDVYADTPGALKVTKTIAGPAAGQHGRIAILVACGGPLHVYAFLIPAHTGPGSASRYFPNLPAGSRCTVSEAADGHTSTVSAAASGTLKVTVPANGTASAHLSDLFLVKAQAPPVTG